MKNQYFGDINDYRKYGLLRALQSGGASKILVAWMLTRNDSRPDGNSRSYLHHPQQWEHFDPQLYNGLVSALPSGVAPCVSLIERSGLLSCACFYSAVVPDARSDRDIWLEGLLNSASGVDLVFLDPDNGIEVPSRPVGRKGSSKYVSWQEIQGLWNAGCSLLIYQHFRRERRDLFSERVISELRRRTGTSFTQAFSTANVLFLLCAQERHEAVLHRGVSCLRARWEGQIRVA